MPVEKLLRTVRALLFPRGLAGEGIEDFEKFFLWNLSALEEDAVPFERLVGKLSSHCQTTLTSGCGCTPCSMHSLPWRISTLMRLLNCVLKCEYSMLFVYLQVGEQPNGSTRMAEMTYNEPPAQEV